MCGAARFTRASFVRGTTADFRHELKQRRHRDEAGGCDVHLCDATLILGGGQDPGETSGIGPDKERWGGRCDELPNCEREEGRVAGAREARHC